METHGSSESSPLTSNRKNAAQIPVVLDSRRPLGNANFAHPVRSNSVSLTTVGSAISFHGSLVVITATQHRHYWRIHQTGRQSPRSALPQVTAIHSCEPFNCVKLPLRNSCSILTFELTLDLPTGPKHI